MMEEALATLCLIALMAGLYILALRRLIGDRQRQSQANQQVAAFLTIVFFTYGFLLINLVLYIGEELGFWRNPNG